MPRDRAPGRPGGEPEIIPPGQDPTRPSERRSGVRISITTRGGPAKPSLSIIALAALALFLLAAIVVVLVSATLVLIPVIAALLGVLVLVGLISGYVRRPKGPRA